MSPLIQSADLRKVFAGAAGAAVVGLLLGGTMHPNLRGDGRPEGPQMLSGQSGPRSYAYGDPGAAFTSYGQTIPDYVIGVDWLKPQPQPQPDDGAIYDGAIYEDPPIPPEAETVVFRDEPAPARAPSPRWQEPERQPVSFPSQAGGVAYGGDLPRPAEPVQAADPELTEMAAATPG